MKPEFNQKFYESFGTKSEASALLALLKAPTDKVFKRHCRDSKEDLQYRVTQRLKTRHAIGPGMQALFALREQEGPLVWITAHKLLRHEPVVAFAVAEGLMQSDLLEKRLMGMGLLCLCCALDGYSLLKEAGMPKLKRLLDPEVKCTKEEKDYALRRVNSLYRGDAQSIGDTVLGQPRIGEQSLALIRDITQAFIAKETHAATGLAASDIFSALQTSGDRIIAGYAAMVVGLRVPKAFREKVLPIFEASQDKGLQLIAKAFGAGQA